ncbi:bacteriohemerythrin [Prochlorothrix hollandica]|uniref:bacteriohemerythrin n=1 Tax=Prochlorothrix hollandica TaxID=1223 RepID=UPI00334143E1
MSSALASPSTLAPIAPWSDDYLTGDWLIDSQHQNLFRLVNQLHASIHQGIPHPGVKPQLEELLRCTLEHFTMEEDRMAAQNYPHLESHCKRHGALVERIQLALRKVMEDETVIPVDVSQCLSEWMIHHIKGEDQRMIEFFRAHNSEGPIAH